MKVIECWMLGMRREVNDMPGFDGTGPKGMGSMTGRGEGYCAFTLPSPGTRGPAYGYAGLDSVPGEIGDYRRMPLMLGPANPMGVISGRFFGKPHLGKLRGLVEVWAVAGAEVGGSEFRANVRFPHQIAR